MSDSLSSGPGLALFARATDHIDHAQLEPVLERLGRDPRIREVVVTTDADEIRTRAPEVVVVAGFVRPALLREMPRLQWYQQWGAGADWLLRHPWAREAPFTLTNVAGIHGVQIGEHVMGLLLALVRRLPEAVEAGRRREWFSPDGATLGELAGRRLLLLGFGAIGRRVARLADAFDMRVTAVKRTPEEPPAGVERIAGLGDLPELLPQAEVVVVTLPLTDETRGLLGAAELARLPQGALLVNIGRGGIVAEDAVATALRDGRLGGAGLDVFDEEPLPPQSPLWDAPNLIITGHYSGATRRYDERALEVFADNVRRFVAGEPLGHVVDKARGY